MARAAKQLRAKNEADKRRRVEKKQGELMLIGHGSTLVGAVAAGLIDERWGGNDMTEVAEMKGIPTNVVLGAVSTVTGAITGGKAGAALLGGGVGLLAAYAYQITREKVEFKEEP